MDDLPEKPRKRRASSKRKPPPPTAWQRWGHWGLLGGGLLGVLVMGGIIMKQRGATDAQAGLTTRVVEKTPEPTSEFLQAHQNEIQVDLQAHYQGNYILLDNDRMAREGHLPKGVYLDHESNQLRSSWGEVVVMGANDEGKTNPVYNHYLVSYADIPSAVCQEFVARAMGSFVRVWIGRQTRSPDPAELVADVSQIAGRCNASPTVAIMLLGK